MTTMVVDADPLAPGLARRLACLTYESLLLFGVVAITALAHAYLTQLLPALEGRIGLMVVLFLMLAIYFVWFWTKGGQTLAMKAWRLRLVSADGSPLSRPRAFARYLLAWVWVLPALAGAHFGGVQSAWNTLGLLILWVLAYAALARLQSQRQFWHDAACGTRLVHWHPPATP